MGGLKERSTPYFGLSKMRKLNENVKAFYMLWLLLKTYQKAGDFEGSL